MSKNFAKHGWELFIAYQNEIKKIIRKNKIKKIFK